MLRNRDGRRVDPVPFLVVCGFALLGSFTFVPVYCLTLGLPLAPSLGVGVVIFAVLSAAAYYRMVWAARPDLQGEVPAESRLQRLFLGALIVVGIMLLLTLLLLSR